VKTQFEPRRPDSVNAVISALKRKPKEKIDIYFYSIDFVDSFEIEGDKELRDHYTQEYWDDFIGSIEDWIDELEAGFNN